jgi:hypothetical protein
VVQNHFGVEIHCEYRIQGEYILLTGSLRTFYNNRHPDLMAHYELVTRPFNDSDWRGELLKDPL